MRIKILLTVALSALIIAYAFSFSKPDPPSIALKNNLFALELYKRISTNEKGNICISPFSITTALAMTYAGADHHTAAEMAKTLHFDSNTATFHNAFGRYIMTLESNAEGNINWSVANRLWVDKRYDLLHSYIDLIQTAYNSPLQPLNFLKQPEISRETINTWVAENTEMRIKDLLPAGAITAETKLVLTNAVFFKANWLNKFQKDKTKPDTFFRSDDNQVMAQFMNRRGALHYMQNNICQAVRIPYEGEKQSMIIVLPLQNIPVGVVEQKLDIMSLNDLYTSPPQDVILSLPKFKMTQGVNLVEYLKSMGMTSAFGDEADFSKMSQAKDLQISDVIHKAFIETDEEGTEAAAATAVIMKSGRTSVSGEIAPIVFKANRPFMFFVLDDETRSILFMGRIENP